MGKMVTTTYLIKMHPPVIRWHYDVRAKEWWCPSFGYDEIYAIKKESGRYKITRGYSTVVGRPKKLSSAKLIVQLLRHG